MRYLFTLLLLLLSMPFLKSEDKKTISYPLTLQTKYEMLDGDFSLTFTSPDTVLYTGHGEKIMGTYMVHPKTGEILINLEKNRPPAASNFLALGSVDEGMLYGGRGTLLAIERVKDKAKGKLSDLDKMGRAEGVMNACRNFASKNGGRLPGKLEELLPDYAPIGNMFADLTPEKAIEGYSYYGATINVTDDPGKIILRTIEPTSDGKQIVVSLDGKSKIVEVK